MSDLQQDQLLMYLEQATMLLERGYICDISLYELAQKLIDAKDKKEPELANLLIDKDA